MRGKDFWQNINDKPARITPAYAGKSVYLAVYAMFFQDHPRVCGEKYTTFRNQLKTAGSPPRMRGKAYDEEHVPYGERITPAYAGKSAHLPAAGALF